MTTHEHSMVLVSDAVAEQPRDEVRVSLRLPEDVYKRLVEHAARDIRSVNAEIVWLLRWAMDQRADDVD